MSIVLILWRSMFATWMTESDAFVRESILSEIQSVQDRLPSRQLSTGSLPFAVSCILDFGSRCNFHQEHHSFRAHWAFLHDSHGWPYEDHDRRSVWARRLSLPCSIWAQVYNKAAEIWIFLLPFVECIFYVLVLANITFGTPFVGFILLSCLVKFLVINKAHVALIWVGNVFHFPFHLLSVLPLNYLPSAALHFSASLHIINVGLFNHSFHFSAAKITQLSVSRCSSVARKYLQVLSINTNRRWIECCWKFQRVWKFCLQEMWCSLFRLSILTEVLKEYSNALVRVCSRTHLSNQVRLVQIYHLRMRQFYCSYQVDNDCF